MGQWILAFQGLQCLQLQGLPDPEDEGLTIQMSGTTQASSKSISRRLESSATLL